jgi:histidinol-phosphate aminotransferase
VTHEEAALAGRSSRRGFLKFSAAASAAMASGVFTEPMLAAAATAEWGKPYPAGAVIIDSNENPLGPCGAAREAIAGISAQGGRYCPWLAEDLIGLFGKAEGLKPEYVRAFPGSSEPLHYSVLAYTSPTKSYVTADPGYEAGMHAAKISGARVAKVPLTATYAHDVKAMLAAGPDAGIFYICSPNNPTGTLTSHADIEYLLQNKPKGAIALVDEAYIHFSDGTSCLDLVKANQDLIVLRTFSKIYGMAGLRCGFAIGRPDLLDKLTAFGGWGNMPVTASAAAIASMKDTQLVAERKKINTAIRSSVFSWFDSKGYSYMPSQSNCFMVDMKKPAKQVIEAFAAENVFVGRVWPSVPTHIRVTVGTAPEMDRFLEVFPRVIAMKSLAYSLPWQKNRNHLDGYGLGPEASA